ncbi:hypothetical protein L596_007833 [Steinernema carpocapsae]|uniref:receptor protein-tyrosine kinase n=1 Tax=Steinernema carpocapsae TaxID=34508 RepID=A0A4U5PAX3_STECR|nr:hypothetical protein L596_007833 [Steinernema carpocapsae]
MKLRHFWRIFFLLATTEAIGWRRGKCVFGKGDGPCICSGEENARSSNNNWYTDPKSRIASLKNIYSNCTTVIGNLELTNIMVDKINGTDQLDFSSPPDLSFLNDIEEVTGYLLIYANELESISLPNLKVVWGDKKFDGSSGVHISQNSNLKILSMPNFRSLQDGTFNVSGNPRLCYFQNKVDFDELLGGKSKDRLNMDDPPAADRFLPNFHYCKDEPQPSCTANCKKNCWGPGESECQIIYRSICPKSCDSGMCFMDKNETKCCDMSCAGGCFGEGKKACTACANFMQDHACVDRCNGVTKYDRIRGISVPLPVDEKRYTSDRYCVNECPHNTLIEDGNCVKRCKPGLAENEKRVCEICPGGICPKKCILEQTLDAGWLRDPRHKNCVKIEGYITLFTHSFEYHLNDKNQTVPGITAEDLEVLSTVKVVTDYIYISTGHNSPATLNFLRNLEEIQGRNQLSQRHTLIISSNTALREMMLAKLKRIVRGDVLISGNRVLCFADSIPFPLALQMNGSVTIRENQDIETCAAHGLVCDKSCNGTLGCWGEGPSMCVKCQNYRWDGKCVGDCPKTGFFKNETLKECVACHDECETCSRPGDDYSCEKCRHVSLKQGNRTQCVLECPLSHFRSGSICQLCDESCYENGCTGPGSFAGPGGCDICEYAYKLDNVSEQFQCIMAKDNNPREICQDNGLTNYFVSGGSVRAKQYLCERCHSECASCRLFGDEIEKSECKCKNYELRSNVPAKKTRCVSDCGPGSMILLERAEGKAGVCQECHQFCDQKKSCRGPFEDQCDACEFGGVRDADGNLKCFAECPTELPYADEGICKEIDPKQEEQKRRYIMYFWIAIILVLTLIVCGILGYYAKKNRRLYKEELEMNPPSIPPQDPFESGVLPDMTRLIIIPKDNLEYGELKLGEGAFGVVYKGYLYPKGRGSGKVPVAIKVLKTTAKDGSAEKEMVEEASLMASMSHKHLLKIAGISLVNGVSIVTPYRKYGCLLEFLKRHQKHLFAKDLLLYCYQIADAMEYLHERKMVHRDLAARNVLVKRPNHVEVTDFGLAKMLRRDEDSIEVNGKVAPKWLALECFEKKTFNEKTDVWAFGVTCWEILTKGCVPYKNKTLRDIQQDLEDGRRLDCPNNVGKDLHSFLILCWLQRPQSRPTFSELKRRLEEFCRRPSEYIREVNVRTEAQTDREMQKIVECYQDSFMDEGDDEFPTLLSDESSQHSPSSPSKPLLPRNGRLRSTESGGTTRYHSDPVPKGHSTVVPLPEAYQVGLKEDSYMVPRSRHEMMEDAVEFYTPVIVDETGRKELTPYYNEVPGKLHDSKSPTYINDAPPTEAPQYMNGESSPTESVSNPTYISGPIAQKETTL